MTNHRPEPRLPRQLNWPSRRQAPPRQSSLPARGQCNCRCHPRIDDSRSAAQTPPMQSGRNQASPDIPSVIRGDQHGSECVPPDRGGVKCSSCTRRAQLVALRERMPPGLRRNNTGSESCHLLVDIFREWRSTLWSHVGRGGVRREPQGPVHARRRPRGRGRAVPVGL